VSKDGPRCTGCGQALSLNMGTPGTTFYCWDCSPAAAAGRIEIQDARDARIRRQTAKAQKELPGTRTQKQATKALRTLRRGNR
jgi:predicted RNA-binding Zn-ribbon protein involved in translation (DUF1610 family)